MERKILGKMFVMNFKLVDEIKMKMNQIYKMSGRYWMYVLGVNVLARVSLHLIFHERYDFKRNILIVGA